MKNYFILLASTRAKISQALIRWLFWIFPAASVKGILWRMRLLWQPMLPPAGYWMKWKKATQCRQQATGELFIQTARMAL